MTHGLSSFLSRCMLLTAVAGITIVSATNAQQKKSTEKGPFGPSDQSLRQYKYPDWFRDAKFGIWSHWGPQAVPREGDWYARNMYIQGSQQNKAHVEKYGPPSKVGYKAIIDLWKAERWDPDKLIALYKRAGAKYFVSMGSHHDNFFLWKSKIHKWNAVNMGPHKDIVGLWQQAAKKAGLYFGVSEHLAASFNWFQPSHGADKTGPLAGVLYDGADPQYQDLYHSKADSADIKNWLTNNPGWHHDWLAYITELVDSYHPDLLYSDSKVPFDETGRTMVAHFYNDNYSRNGGVLSAVYTPKEASEGRWVRDVERGVLDTIAADPWQTDTSIGDWFYRTGQKYKTPDEIAQLLVDIVSKNGNLLLNVVQTPEGDLEPDVVNIINGLADWMLVNGEGIFASRPWKIYGEGPSTLPSNQTKGHFGGLSDTRSYQSADIRFTTKGDTLFAYCMNLPEGDIRIASAGSSSKYMNKKIAAVSMLGNKEKLQWVQEAGALVISRPAHLPAYAVTAYKIVLK